MVMVFVPAVGPLAVLSALTSGVRTTASKSLPGIWVRACRSSSLQRVEGAPLRYQGLPLSATIIP